MRFSLHLDGSKFIAGLKVAQAAVTRFIIRLCREFDCNRSSDGL
jgi:hypothetical protein